eukprot:g2348.t1
MHVSQWTRLATISTGDHASRPFIELKPEAVHVVRSKSTPDDMIKALVDTGATGGAYMSVKLFRKLQGTTCVEWETVREGATSSVRGIDGTASSHALGKISFWSSYTKYAPITHMPERAMVRITAIVLTNFAYDLVLGGLWMGDQELVPFPSITNTGPSKVKFDLYCIGGMLKNSPLPPKIKEHRQTNYPYDQQKTASEAGSKVAKRYTYESPAEGIPKILYAKQGIYKAGTNATVVPAKAVVIPNEETHMQERIVRYLHTSIFAVHPGVNATEQAIRARYYWRGIAAAAEKFVRNCVRCALAKGTDPKRSGFLQTYISKGVNDTLCIDLIILSGQASRNEFGYIGILTMVDRFSGYVRTCPVKSRDAPVLAAALVYNWFILFGAPLKIISDNEFRTHDHQAMLSTLESKWGYTTPQHSMMNTSERYNRTIQERIRVLIHEYKPRIENPRTGQLASWPVYLPFATAALNNTPIRNTSITPFALMFARQYRLPGDTCFVPKPGGIPLSTDAIRYSTYRVELMKGITEFVTKLQMEKRAINAKQYNRKQLVTDFKEGDLVMLWTATRVGKLAERLRGPFKITKMWSPVNCKLRHTLTGEIQERIHVARLRKFTGTVEDGDSDGDEVPELPEQEDPET